MIQQQQSQQRRLRDALDDEDLSILIQALRHRHYGDVSHGVGFLSARKVMRNVNRLADRLKEKGCDVEQYN